MSTVPAASVTEPFAPLAAGGSGQPITLRQAKKLIQAMAHEQSFLLLAPPGVGKSDLVFEAAREAGLPCRSLLGTQIAPEDVSGVPRIVGERSVFCPPRALLPEGGGPFCLFLDELPACAPDVQKAFYSLLLERRIGEFALPRGSWVVAAGNRMQDRALVRAMSSALVNRVTVLHVRVDVPEWLQWAAQNRVREDVRRFVATVPDALLRPVPDEPVPFSTPRAWVAFSRAIDAAQSHGVLDAVVGRALAFGRLSPQDAAVFCALAEETAAPLRPLAEYLHEPALLPAGESARWFVLDCIRQHLKGGLLPPLDAGVAERFLRALPDEHQLAVIADLVARWSELGADEALLALLERVSGLDREAPEAACGAAPDAAAQAA
jgi:MoxR-like ATPase